MAQLTMTLVDLALKVYREKSNALPVLLSHEVETGFKVLLHLANADSAWMSEASLETGATRAELKAAAIYFIERYAFKGKMDPYQVLGLSPMATEPEAKVHYRLMMRLFHPDRTSLSLKRARDYAAIINQAMDTLQSKNNKALSFSTSRSRSPLNLPRDQPNRYQPDSSFMKNLRSGILHYSLFFLAAILGLSLYLMYAWRQSHPIIQPEESRFSKEDALPSITQLDPLPSHPEDPTLTPPKLESLDEEAPIKLPEPKALNTEPEDSSPLSLPKSLIQKIQPLKAKEPLTTKAITLNNHPGPPTLNPSQVPEDMKPPGAHGVKEERLQEAEVLPEKPFQKPPIEKICSLQDMRSLTYDFVDAYNEGKLEDLMQLMADNIKTESHVNKTELRMSYAKLFATTTKREMVLRNLQFDVLPSSVKAKSHYQVKFFDTNHREPRMVSGELEIEGAMDHALPKIMSLYNRTITP